MLCSTYDYRILHEGRGLSLQNLSHISSPVWGKIFVTAKSVCLAKSFREGRDGVKNVARARMRRSSVAADNGVETELSERIVRHFEVR